MQDEEFQLKRKREELSRDPAWRAVFVIFDKLGRDRRIWNHVDLKRETIQFKDILEDGTFSSQQYRMLEIAASLFNQDHKINLWTVLGPFDQSNKLVILEAIRTFVE
jgi:hypothetical protein